MAEGERRRWTFLTNHAQVLLCIARDPGMRLRDIAQSVGITERSAQSILADLVDAGCVTRTRVGRRNSYVIDPHVPLRHELSRHHDVGELLEVLVPTPETARSPTSTRVPQVPPGENLTRGDRSG